MYLHTYVYTHMTRVFLEVEKLTLNVTGKNKHKKLLVNFSFFKKRKMEMDFFFTRNKHFIVYCEIKELEASIIRTVEAPAQR